MKWSSKFHAATNGEGATCTLNLSDAPLRDEDSLCDHQNKRHRDPDRAGTVSPPPHILNLDASLNPTPA